MSGVLRVGNCSGFYGDRISAMREMLDGGEVDVLTGDYLAELTMLILGRDMLKDPALGYARTFVRQAEDCLGTALEKGVGIVANAGGLNPAGLAEKLREVAKGLGLEPLVAHVEGDDVRHRADELGFGKPLTSNAYLGAFGIAEALTAGADVVVTGRVTDASLVVGPAVAHFGWQRTAYDELAGATVAGHVIECGTQATGGNFSGFMALEPGTRPLGFPIAEISADGSSVITKHPGTGGAVTLDTVTAQLMYEVQGPTYLGPDVATHLDTVAASDAGPDRVRISGVRGSAPPGTLKVCVNELGGYRNGAELVLVGLDVEAKAEWIRAQVETALAARPPASVEWSLARTDRADADTEEAASCRLRLNVRDNDADVVGKAFTAPLVELALASYPGFTLTGPPTPATPYGIYRAAYISQFAVPHRVIHPDGRVSLIEPPAETAAPARDDAAAFARDGGRGAAVEGLWPGHGGRARDERAGAAEAAVPRTPSHGTTARVPLGTIVHARSGDKGGDANVGLWAVDAANRPDRVEWLTGFVTEDAVRRLVPEAADLEIEVHPLANLGGVNVVIHGLLGEGVAASSRFDPQAKALGEWVRSRHVEIPEALL